MTAQQGAPAPQKKPDQGQAEMQKPAAKPKVPGKETPDQPAKAAPVPAKAKGQQVQQKKPAAAPAKPAPKPAPAAKVLHLQSSASAVPKARPKRRHYFVASSFLLLVLLPALGAFGYLYTMALDRFTSNAAFSVHKEDGSGAMDLMSGLPGLGVAPGGTPDADILYQFIQSQAMVEAVDEEIDLRNAFGRFNHKDPLFSLDPEASLESLIGYWGRAVSIIYEPDIGIISVEVSAFTPLEAQHIAEVILLESSDLIDELSRITRDDGIRMAKSELDGAADRVRETRLEMSKFRDVEQIIDPTVDFAGQMGVITALQQSLADAMVKRDLLVGTTTNPNDPRTQQAERTITAIENRIEEERAKVGALSETRSGDPLSRVVGQYESLVVDREFAERSYVAALAAYDSALAEARRQTRYLSVHIEPTLAETAVYPKRLTMGILTTVFLLLAWALFALSAYSIRDRR